MVIKEDEGIEVYRQKITALDREILTLVKKREEWSLAIDRKKRAHALPQRDFAREKTVFDNARTTAKELGLPLDFAVSLQKLILEDSLSRQEQDRIENSFLGQKSVLVIGGSGRLGSWLCRFFADCGHSISVVDPVRPKFSCTYKTSFDESADLYDLIVVATPIRASIEILKKILSLKLKNPVIFDVSSVKNPVQEVLINLKNSGAHVTSLHPMFGPSVQLLFGKHIVRCSLGVPKADSLVNELFAATSLQVVDMSIDEHDEIISLLLALTHAFCISFAHALNRSGFPAPRLENFSSPTFANLLAISKKVMSENPHLYYEIQALNPHTKRAHALLENALSDVIASIKKLDEDAFVDIMKRAQQYVGT